MLTLFSTPFGFLFTLMLALTLTACGGGGGGGGGSSSSGDASPAELYSGAKTKVVINEANALSAAMAPLSALDLLILAMQFEADVPSFDTVKAGTETTRGESGGSVRISVSKANGQVVIDFVFNKYASAGTVVNGRIKQVSNGPSVDSFASGYFKLDGSMQYEDLQIDVDGASLLLNGLIESDKSNVTTLTAEILAKNLDDGEEILLSNFVATVQHSAGQKFYGSNSDLYYLMGSVYDSSIGLLEVETRKPLQGYYYSEEDNLLAGGGLSEIEVSSMANRVTFVGLNRQFSSIVLTHDDPDISPKAKRLTWTEISVGADVASVVNVSPPVANVRQLYRSSVGVATVVNGLFSHDTDRDFIGYQWQLVHAPLQSNAVKGLDFTQPVFEFVPDVEGEYLFSLEVFDGLNKSKISTLVKVDDKVSNDFNPIVGALEITPAQNGTKDFQVSALSSVVSAVESERIYDPYWSIGSESGSYAYSAPSITDETTAQIFPDPKYSEFLYVRYNGLQRTPLKFFADSRVSDFVVKLGLGEAGLDNSSDEDGLFYDVDGDGDLDVIRLSAERARIYLFEEGGYTLFKELDVVINGHNSWGNSRVNVGDVSSDGFLDLIIVTEWGYFVATQDAAGDFSELQLSAENLGCYDYRYEPYYRPQVADYDGDGLNDIIMDFSCSAHHGYVNGMSVWLGMPNGDLADPFVIPIKYAMVGEFNGDGRVDFVVPNYAFSDAGYSSELHVYENTENGLNLIYKFSNLNWYDYSSGLKIHDLDGDGLQDIVHVNGPNLHIHQQLKPGEIHHQAMFGYENVDFGGRHTAIAVSDMDGNGEYDIALNNLGTSIQLFQDDGEMSLFKHTGHSDLHHANDIKLIDYNGDGLQDVVLLDDELFIYYGGQKSYSIPVR